MDDCYDVWDRLLRDWNGNGNGNESVSGNGEKWMNGEDVLSPCGPLSEHCC